ncbi:MAG: hypothetical protein FJY79_02515 [Candidatus Aminicenantes bacterium]|nr:hypothetical protein [Candidatus Aminicenantes bacterium]
MSATTADIFMAAADIESFRRAITALDGEFDFDSAAMIALGQAYFQRYPDREHDRKMDEVRLGYELVRICAIEKMVRGLPADRKEVYRAALSNAATIGPAADGLVGSIGAAGLAADLARLSAALENIKRAIDEIPKGMIRERFAGGVSALFNILYVFKLKIRPPAL